MARITLNILRKGSTYYAPAQAVQLESAQFQLDYTQLWYGSQADEDTGDTSLMTFNCFTYRDRDVNEFYVTEETAAEIDALIAAASGGGGTPFPVEFTDTVWYDSTGTLFIRRVIYDELAGTSTITDYETDGVTPYTPTYPITPSTGDRVEIEAASFAVTVVIENPTDTTTYVGYSTQKYLNGSYDLTDTQWSIMKIVEQTNGSTTTSFANSLRFSYGLVFNSGANEYLGYTYTN